MHTSEPNSTGVGIRRQKSMRWSLFVLAALMLLPGGAWVFSIEAAAQFAADVPTKPLILEKDDGEHRVRRPRETPMPTAEFTIKVDPKNGGSRHLVLGTETIPPGGRLHGTNTSDRTKSSSSRPVRLMCGSEVKNAMFMRDLLSLF